MSHLGANPRPPGRKYFNNNHQPPKPYFAEAQQQTIIMRTYDIEKLFEYCTECADQCAADNEPLDMGIPCVVALAQNDNIQDAFLDWNGDYFFTLTHHACADGRLNDICIKSVQVNESSQLSSDEVNVLLKKMNEGFAEHFPKYGNDQVTLQDCVLLEISFTTIIDHKRFTETVLASNDWFDNISDFCDSWNDECLQ